MQFIDIGEQLARYIKLEVLNTWAGPQAPPFYKQLRIDEIKVGVRLPALSCRPAAAGGRVPAQHPQRQGPHRPLRGLLRLAPGHRARRRRATRHLPRRRRSPTAGDLPAPARPHDAGRRLAVGQRQRRRADRRYRSPPATRTCPAVRRSPYRCGPAPTRSGVSTRHGPGLDRIAVGPLPPASYVPKTTHDREAVRRAVGRSGPAVGRRSSATLRLDVDDALDQVRLAPVVPAGLDGHRRPGRPRPACGSGRRSRAPGRSPRRPARTSARCTVPVDGRRSRSLGRPKQVTKAVPVRLRPADRVFMREAEDSRNQIGSAGITSCSACSGGQKVRNIGGSPETRTWCSTTSPWTQAGAVHAVHRLHRQRRPLVLRHRQRRRAGRGVGQRHRQHTPRPSPSR